MRKYLVTAATVAALACSSFIAGKAHAATTFEVSGTFNNCPGCSLGGNAVIDTATGSFVSENITVTGTVPPVGPFTSLNGSPFTNGFNQLVVAFAGNPASNLDLIFPTATLAGYAGGLLCGTITTCNGNTTSGLSIPTGNFILASGSLTPAGVSAVPLPGALPLFATGLGALGLLGWRRKKKAHAA
jgi:hypothetical protein